MRRISLGQLMLASLILSACGGVDASDPYLDTELDTAQSPLYTANRSFWYEHNNEIPICWKTSGYAAQKALIREAVESSWEALSALNFTGWQDCPSTGTFVTVSLFNDGTFSGVSGIGPDEALKSVTDPASGMELHYNFATHTDRQIRQLVYHEFGHLTGHRHEQLRQDNNCGGVPNGTGAETTEFDPWSIMADRVSCRGGTGHLDRPSGLDLFGNQLNHGSPTRWGDPTRNFCVASDETLYIGDFNNDGLDDLLCNQTDGDMFVDLASVNGTFTGSDWSMSARNFCVASNEKLYIGDFNNDGRDDLLCNQGNGGMRIDYASASGTFTGSDWIKSDRNFCLTSGDKLYVGDFNGDDYDDVLCNQSDGDMEIDYADTLGRLISSDWTMVDRNFCVTSTEKLYVGDFNGDGRDDLLCNQTDGEFFVDHASTSGTFTGSNWSDHRYFCHDGGSLHVADLNGDDHDDLLCRHTPSGTLKIELADLAGRFDDTDVLGNAQPDGVGVLGEFCDGGELYTGQFNSMALGRETQLAGRADLLCLKSSGAMDIQYNLSAPALSETDVSIAASGVKHYGPFTTSSFVLSGGEVNALLAGFSGNADLYVRWGAPPTTTTYDCKDTGADSFAHCRITGTGSAYVMVVGASAVDDLSVQVFLESFGVFTP
ncbi:FG-GAP-like repeat-containing protein [Sorangium sp. So ce1099]|uniref:FG-GAP-like repeat-containing protein n=1 Tax=Sorangium sp. So ce1099 TaxID=3133331 RepID=UPI003F64486B